MPLTLTSGATVVTLPDDLLWVDEYSPWKVAQIDEYSLTGALIRHESAKLAGRPITLQSGTDFAWVARSVIEQLATLELVANGPVMVLMIPNYPSGHRSFSVGFRRDTGAIEAAQLKHRTPPAPTDYYSLVLRLTEVA